VKALSVFKRSRHTDELEYWSRLARDEYRHRFGLELDALQSDRARTPGVGDVARIQSDSKAVPELFLATGLRAALTYLDELISAGVDPARLDSILEFGVGYARILRHLAPLRAELHGCDVTPETIRWCQENVGGLGSFVVSAEDPPLPYADAHFDFVYANSVFTHIQSERTPAWIRELRRVTRAGGIVITSHYDLNEHLRRFSPEAVDHAFRRVGFLEWGDDSVRQRNICYAPERLESLWAEHFELVRYRSHFREQAHLVCRVAS
jgi:SAM-dependent methyltransferase